MLWSALHDQGKWFVLTTRTEYPADTNASAAFSIRGQVERCPPVRTQIREFTVVSVSAPQSSDTSPSRSNLLVTFGLPHDGRQQSSTRHALACDQHYEKSSCRLSSEEIHAPAHENKLEYELHHSPLAAAVF